jgi:hypothetical protein
MSLASAEAAEARRKAAATLGYYNLKLGPTAWNFDAGTAVIYNDNINYASQNPEGDVVFRPELETHVLWPVSAVNSLTLTLGAGYSAYVRHSELDRLFLVPGSETSFDIYSGDFWINLHDRFSITDNAFQDPTYAGTGDYQRLENTVGVAATWDLNKIILKAGYDHLNYSALSGPSLRVRDEQSELLTMSGSYALRPEVRLGLELSGGLTSYSYWDTTTSTTMTLQGDGRQWSAGPFAEVRLSENMRFRLGVGYTAFEPESKNSLGGRVDGPYGRVALAHRVNKYLDYALSGGREITFNSYSGIVDLYQLEWQANWHILRKVTVGTSFSYQHGNEAAYGVETFDWFSPRISLSRPLTRKLTADFGYRYFQRGSTLAANRYTANVVSLNLTYQF